MLWLVEEALVRCVIARVENDGRSVGAYATMLIDSDTESNLVGQDSELSAEVERVIYDFEDGSPRILLICKGGMLYRGRLSEYIGLLHRPYPEGKTEAGMSDEVSGLAFQVFELGDKNYEKWMQTGKLPVSAVPGFDEAVVCLRETIEVYELGKPQK